MPRTQERFVSLLVNLQVIGDVCAFRDCTHLTPSVATKSKITFVSNPKTSTLV